MMKSISQSSLLASYFENKISLPLS